MASYMKCPICATALIDPTFCGACITRITRNDRGEVERAQRRNPLHGRLQTVYQRRPNAASALEHAGPRTANVHATTANRFVDVGVLDGWLIGTDRAPRTKGAAA